MRKIAVLFMLLAASIIPAYAAESSFGLEEYATVEEFVAAIAVHFPEGQDDGSGRSLTPRRKLKLAAIPVTKDRVYMVPELLRRLAASDRLDILDTGKTTAYLKDKGQAGPALAREMGRVFELDGILAIRAYPSQGKQLIVARIFPAAGTQPPDPLLALLDLRPNTAAGEGDLPLVVSAKERGVAIPDLPVAARYFSVADMDGDGTDEYVFSDGSRLSVYRLEPSGWRRVWMQSEAEGAGRKHLYLDVADVNGNNRPEIFVSFMGDRRNVLSSVFEAEKGTFRRIAELPGFLRVLVSQRRGLVLLGQEYEETRFFGGTPREYSWSGTGYVAGAEFSLPKETNLYGFVSADFGEPHALITALDEKGRLSVYSRGTLMWKSEERYGGSETVAVESSTDAYNLTQKVALKGRFFAQDLDNDGKDEIIIPRNIGSEDFASPGEAELYVLEWTGARLEPRLVVKKAPGAILDLRTVRRDAGEAEAPVLVEIKAGIFSKAGSRLIIYPLK